MSEYAPIAVRGIYRSSSHLPIWEVINEAGIWQQVGIQLESFDYCDSSAVAEAALLAGDIDFISGNHITPYTIFARGQHIVHLTSPTNSVHDSLASPEPLGSLLELRGRRLGDTAAYGPRGGYAHNRGNHMLYVLRAGLELIDVEWVELADQMGDEFRQEQLSALLDGRIDATFVTGGTERFEQAGVHLLRPDPLPMINGPTATTTTDRLRRDDQFGERLVKAQVLAIHYTNSRREETDRILASLASRRGDARAYTADRVARMSRKPYPDLQGIANAYKLACLLETDAQSISPLALWDLHYLRQLDDSGYIDALYVQPVEIASR